MITLERYINYYYKIKIKIILIIQLFTSINLIKILCKINILHINYYYYRKIKLQFLSLTTMPSSIDIIISKLKKGELISENDVKNICDKAM